MGSRGIILIGTGDAYRRWAVNCAITCKYHSPSLPITLITDELNFEFNEKFDVIKLVKKEDYFHNGKFSPGLIKLSLNQLTNYDETIYVDVDSIVCKPLESLFDYLPFYSHVASTTDKDSQGWSCQWASKEIVDRLYLSEKESYILPEINSSILVFDNSQMANSIFDKGLQIAKEIDHSILRLWGGTFPDELGFNISMALNDYKIESNRLIYTRVRKDKTVSGINATSDRPEWIAENFYTLTVFGDLGFNHSSLIKDNCRQGLYYQLGDKCGRLPYKLHGLMSKKHVKNK